MDRTQREGVGMQPSEFYRYAGLVGAVCWERVALNHMHRAGHGQGREWAVLALEACAHVRANYQMLADYAY